MNGALITRAVRADADSLLALHASNPDRYPALLESAATAGTLGAYDILFAFPQHSLRLTAEGFCLRSDGTQRREPFLSNLDQCWRETRIAKINSPLPFHGGWFVYLSYELAGEIEPRLRLSQSQSDLIAIAVRIPAAIVVERTTGQAWAIAEPEHADLIAAMTADIDGVSQSDALKSDGVVAGAIEEDPPVRYLEIIRRALTYIERGDIYQANLSRAWRGRLREGVQPHDVYRRLRGTNPGPFCGLAVLPGLAIVSSSPERLVRVRNGEIATRPIAGTRPRGPDAASDQALVAELRAHPKERAEHIMLIDLERNDLGRVCEAGTVEVDEYMTIESYAHVHHIVSNVRGQLREGMGPGQVLKAVFPGGTITGCPKVRCMEIIAELEDTARGAYTGSLGYINRDGSMDFNILIRSLELRNGGFELRAGAGIVADSIPERELDESRAKARGVLRALE